MAFKKIVEIQGDAVIQSPDGTISLGAQKAIFEAYCKIESIIANKERGHVTMSCVADKYKATKRYDVPLSVANDAPNFIRQAYLHLKTLPEWANAVDC